MRRTPLTAEMDERPRLKQVAAEHAVTFVESCMVLGLGAGSTAVFALRRIAQLLHDGPLRNVVGVPCSDQVAAEARRLNIPLTPLNDHPAIDLTIGGADDVDPDLNLIKGGGGALLREKIVAQASRREIIVVDEDKLSPMLSTHWAVPVEAIHFGWRTHMTFLESLGAQVKQRLNSDGRPFTTDQGNLILDCSFGAIAQPGELAAAISSRAGVVEHGLFLGLATDVIVAGTFGVRHLRRQQQQATAT